jgi:hypothetical protein
MKEGINLDTISMHLGFAPILYLLSIHWENINALKFEVFFVGAGTIFVSQIT